jgi:hypothetical protein
LAAEPAQHSAGDRWRRGPAPPAEARAPTACSPRFGGGGGRGIGERNPKFPHDPTSDQFLTDQSFESYRALGRLAAENALAESLDP